MPIGHEIKVMLHSRLLVGRKCSQSHGFKRPSDILCEASTPLRTFKASGDCLPVFNCCLGRAGIAQNPLGSDTWLKLRPTKSLACGGVFCGSEIGRTERQAAQIACSWSMSFSFSMLQAMARWKHSLGHVRSSAWPLMAPEPVKGLLPPACKHMP